MEKKNNKWVIILLIIIIIILGGLCYLFATDKITFNQPKDGIIQENESDDAKNNSENVKKQNHDMYDVVLEQYRNVLNDKIDDFGEIEKKYSYVSSNRIHQCVSYNECDIFYSYYDINNDGTDELLLDYNLVDIFTYDGNDVIKLFDESNCIAEGRCSMKIYDNGKIAFSGSGGASVRYNKFYEIDNYKSKIINSYETDYGENGEVIIKDSNNNITSYKTEEDLIKANIGTAEILDLDNILDWKKID